MVSPSSFEDRRIWLNLAAYSDSWPAQAKLARFDPHVMIFHPPSRQAPTTRLVGWVPLRCTR
jgi:hypothetical protein